MKIMNCFLRSDLRRVHDLKAMKSLSTWLGITASLWMGKVIPLMCEGFLGRLHTESSAWSGTQTIPFPSGREPVLWLMLDRQTDRHAHKNTQSLTSLYLYFWKAESPLLETEASYY